ncbi:MAG: ABC transporter permease [Chitinophagales bacterium]|nr:ABC transporter permease [Chitinophagales bacterium]MDW8418337.1 FtsX-like permease family protein [Chitinophagales bacterium]
MLAARIAFRYLFSPKSTHVINLITWVSMLGMGFGAMALVCVLSVFNGFEGLVLSLYNSFYPDIEVRAEAGKTFEEKPDVIKKILSVSGVVAVSRTLEENAYFEYGDEKKLGVIKGVDDNYTQVTRVHEFVRLGEYRLRRDSLFCAVIGANISFPMNIDVEESFEPLRITVPRKGVRNALLPGELFNTMFTIPAGVFSIQQEFDSKYVITDLHFVQRLTESENTLSAYEVKVNQEEDIEQVKVSLQKSLGTDYRVLARYEQKAEMYRIMKIERWVTTAILTFILLIISFNIIGSLTMLVIDKTKDIAILKAMGGTQRLIKHIYLLNGLFAAMLGAGAGMFIGYIICLLQMKFHFLKLGGAGSTFVIDYYPVELHARDFVLTLVIIVCIALLASYLPARRAGEREMQFK